MNTLTGKTSYTIGLLIGSAEDRYENALLRGVYDSLVAGGHRLVSFTSGGIRSYHGFEAQGNVLYDLISARRIDGLVLSGALSHTISGEEMQRFCRRYAPLPMVGVAIDQLGLHRLIVDGQAGMRQVVEHLITRHHYQRLAFICGPQGNREAEDRFQAFQEVLKAHHLSLTPHCIACGDYTYHSGRQAMQSLLDSGKGEFEVVVAANDSMALGAIAVLQEQGYRVPADMAVTGFDDTLEARFSNPPLTTVRQLVYWQGRSAAEMLLRLLRGETIPERQIAPAQMVLRHSCGCDQHTGISSQMQQVASRADLPMALSQFLLGIPADLALCWTTELVQALYADLSKGQGRFLDRFALILQHPESAGVEGQVWLQILAVLRYRLLLHLPQAASRQVEDLLHNAQGLVLKLIEQRQLVVRVRLDHALSALRELEEILFTTFTLPELLQAIADELPRAGVTACSMALFDDPNQPANWSRLLLAYHADRVCLLPTDVKHFRSRSLAPDDTWIWRSGQNVVVEALYSREARLGFVLLELPPDLAEISGALRGLLSGALQNVLLLEARRQAEQRLLEINQEVQNKANELERFTYSVAHDLKGPLRGLDGYGCLLQDDYGEQLGEDGLAFIRQIRLATGQMHRLIDGLLDYAHLERRQVSLELVALRSLIDRALQQIAHDLEDANALLSLEASEMWVLAEPDELLLVLQQLLDNALKFSRSTLEPRINIRVQEHDGRCLFSIQDNGIGFEMQYHDRIFEIFQRLNRVEDYSGTGAGLALVRKAMQRIGGRVWAESAPGAGATFYLEMQLASPLDL